MSVKVSLYVSALPLSLTRVPLLMIIFCSDVSNCWQTGSGINTQEIKMLDRCHTCDKVARL